MPNSHKRKGSSEEDTHSHKKRARNTKHSEIDKLTKSDKKQIKRYVRKELRIKKFNLKCINTNREGKRILIVGRSGSGKSCAAIEIMRVLKDIPAWMIVSKSEAGNKNYSPFANEVIIHEEFNEEILYKLKNRQIKLCEDWLIPRTSPKEYYSDPSAVLVLDDISDDAKTFRTPISTWFFQISRNFRVIMVLLIQYIKTIPPPLRINISHVFLYSQNSNEEIKKLYREFGGSFKNVHEFTKVLNKCTQNYGCMVIDCMAPSTKVEDSVYHFRARKMEDQLKDPFHVGNDWSSEQMKSMLNKNWREKHRILDDLGPKKKRTLEKEHKAAPKQKKPKKIVEKELEDDSPILEE